MRLVAACSHRQPQCSAIAFSKTASACNPKHLCSLTAAGFSRQELGTLNFALSKLQPNDCRLAAGQHVWKSPSVLLDLRLCTVVADRPSEANFARNPCAQLSQGSSVVHNGSEFRTEIAHPSHGPPVGSEFGTETICELESVCFGVENICFRADFKSEAIFRTCLEGYSVPPVVLVRRRHAYHEGYECREV